MKQWKKPGGLVIGITGGIACGKSEVGRWLAAQGLDVVDSDALAHQAIQPDGAAYADVVAYFGAAVVADDGTIDRRALGRRVFADATARAALNERVHPVVRQAWRAWAAALRQRDAVGVVLIPLLFEVGAETEMDVTICVTADEEQVLHRLQERGLSAEESRQRIAAQMPLEEKRRRADYVIENNESLQRLTDQTRAVLQRIQEKENISHGG